MFETHQKTDRITLFRNALFILFFFRPRSEFPKSSCTRIHGAFIKSLIIVEYFHVNKYPVNETLLVNRYSNSRFALCEGITGTYQMH